ncbi:uncharacterized protein [Panulirus ornatus]|uniref:uncharacterized protein n=1 Tax=Panulirus ornatus TaxID=150431 RepID=UPI003A898E65
MQKETNIRRHVVTGQYTPLPKLGALDVFVCGRRGAADVGGGVVVETQVPSSFVRPPGQPHLQVDHMVVRERLGRMASVRVRADYKSMPGTEATSAPPRGQKQNPGGKKAGSKNPDKKGEKGSKKKSKKKSAKEAAGGRVHVDILGETAMQNALYICHSVQELLYWRGYQWAPGGKKQKGKKGKKGR